MNLMKYTLCFFVLSLGVFFSTRASALDWQEIKGKHFVVYYDNVVNRSAAENTLSNAENHYSKIATLIGYARYSNFWTWGDRVKIFLFPSQEAFSKETRQPEWSRGGAFHSDFSNERMIASYVNQPLFLTEVLPHEIAHLVLYDFVGSSSRIPQWFNEGVAQLAEENKARKSDVIMRISVRLNSYFPFKLLDSYNVLSEADTSKVGLFYAQSVSMVDFLIKKFGSEKFGLLCRQIAVGKGFQDAFFLIYGTSVDSMENFERKWISYLNE